MFSGSPPKFVWNPKHKRWDSVPAGESKLEQWAASSSPDVWSRLSRKRKLTRNKLKFPSKEKLLRISSLAEVSDHSGFGQLIFSIILDAHWNHASRKVSNEKVRASLDKVRRRARLLKKVLGEIDVGAPAEYAGLLLEGELGKVQFKERLILFPDWTDLLDLLASATSSAEQRLNPKRGRKAAAGGNFAFDTFVRQLLMAAPQWGSRWSLNRRPDGTYEGTLLKAISILKPYLPDKLLPQNVNLGRSVEHIRKKLKDQIARNTN
jgi:hypothetical protein